MNLFELQKQYREGTLAKADYIVAMSEIHSILFEYATLLPDTDVSAITITGGRVLFTLKGPDAGLRMVGDPSDQRMAPLEILNFNAYEPAHFDMVMRLLKDGQTVMDIGANIGWYSLQIAAALPSARILAFEPIPKTFSFLKRNLELNRSANISIHNFGFWNKADTLTFYFYPEGSANASAANVSGRETVTTLECPVYRLDDFVAEQDLHVDFIKCDVEGAELMVFEGSLETLRRDAPVVYTEMLRKWSAKFDYHPNQLIRLFAEVGYRCYTVREGFLQVFSKMDETTVDTNFIFLHPQRHALQLKECLQP